jgi:putative ATPase
VSDAGLFESAAQERLARQAPLAARLRPRTLDDVVGQDHLVGPDGALRALCEQGRLPSLLLWGPAGTGKTTLAQLLADAASLRFVALSATSAGVRDAREAIETAARALGEHGARTALFVDEVHRFTTSQQDVLLPAVEEGVVVFLGATTENPYFEVNAPLLSRTSLFRLAPLDEAALRTLVARGAAAEDVAVDDAAAAALVDAADGDARALLGTLEVAATLARVRAEHPGTVGVADVLRARDGRIRHQGRDEHYDQASALIKSVRGSDPDAALYWLARMLDAGESPRFVARRLVILASEDVGMADASALVVATAAAHALELVGLPEAQLALAQATVHLALAPKSNRVTVALGAAQRDVQAGPHTDVPAHLRGAGYASAATLGHGVGYAYPHDDPRGWVEQQYLPDEFVAHRYWTASSHGEEPARDAWRHRAREDAPPRDDRDGERDRDAPTPRDGTSSTARRAKGDQPPR